MFIDNEFPDVMRRVARISIMSVCLIAFALAGCKKNEETVVPNTFNSMSTEEKMAYLMKHFPPDSVAYFICDAAMGKQYDSRLELGDALTYAYTHYKESDQVIFDEAFNQYGEKLPLSDMVKFYRMANLSDPEIFAYEMGLRYVGTIRDKDKDAKQVKEELDRFRTTCKTESETYKRFIKGFKEALRIDRGHDLDEKIYTQFIIYPDTIQ